jgi:hypothetical protein
VNTVWIRGQADVLVRADSIVLLTIAHGGLSAECVGGRTVRLANSECPGALQLALLDEILRAGSDDRHAVVITPPAEQDSATWRRECADTLLELQVARDSRLPAPGSGPPTHAPRRSGCRASGWSGACTWPGRSSDPGEVGSLRCAPCHTAAIVGQVSVSGHNGWPDGRRPGSGRCVRNSVLSQGYGLTRRSGGIRAATCSSWSRCEWRSRAPRRMTRWRAPAVT